MPAPAKGPRLGGGPAHERLILANLATALFEHGRITTTVTKAKRLQPLAERLITFAKRGDLHARRRVLRVIRDKGVVHVLFTEIAPAMADRDGGCTRITKVGNRKGDNAPMATIELVREPVTPKPARKKAAVPGTAAPAAAVPVEVTTPVVAKPAVEEVLVTTPTIEVVPETVTEIKVPTDAKVEPTPAGPALVDDAPIEALATEISDESAA